MSFEASASKFGASIALKNLDTSGMLVFHKFLKLKENIKEIKFKFQRIKPSESRVVINKNDIIKKTRIGFDGGRIPKVAMNKI